MYVAKANQPLSYPRLPSAELLCCSRCFLRLKTLCCDRIWHIMELFYLFHDHVQQSVMRLCCLVCNAHQTQDSSLYHHDVYLFMRMGTGSLMGEEGEGQFVAIIFVIFSFRKKQCLLIIALHSSKMNVFIILTMIKVTLLLWDQLYWNRKKYDTWLSLAFVGHQQSTICVMVTDKTLNSIDKKNTAADVLHPCCSLMRKTTAVCGYFHRLQPAAMSHRWEKLRACVGTCIGCNLQIWLAQLEVKQMVQAADWHIGLSQSGISPHLSSSISDPLLPLSTLSLTHTQTHTYT